MTKDEDTKRLRKARAELSDLLQAARHIGTQVSGEQAVTQAALVDLAVHAKHGPDTPSLVTSQIAWVTNQREENLRELDRLAKYNRENQARMEALLAHIDEQLSGEGSQAGGVDQLISQVDAMFTALQMTGPDVEQAPVGSQLPREQPMANGSTATANA